MPSKGQILFIGSSSFRIWKTFASDLAGISAINRGFGGSTMTDALYYFDRMVVKYAPSTVVVYEGDNDLNKGKSIEELAKEYEEFSNRLKKALPKIRAAVAAKDYAKAEELQGAVMRGDRARPSLGLGWLDLKLLHGETFTDFYQSFDLDQALVETRYTVDGVTYTKRALCSHPDQVIALQLTASKEGALSFTVDMSGFADQYLSGTTVSGEGNDLVISGNARIISDLMHGARIVSIVFNNQDGWFHGDFKI